MFGKIKSAVDKWWYTMNCDSCHENKICKNKIKLLAPKNWNDWYHNNNEDTVIITMHLCEDCANEFEKNKGFSYLNEK